MIGDRDDLYVYELGEGEEGKGIPIPRRTSKDQAGTAPLQKGEAEWGGSGEAKESRNTIQGATFNTQGLSEERAEKLKKLYESIVKINKGPVMLDFPSQARFYQNEKAEYAELVPFHCYWPTYDAMTDSQRKWYFYWRECMRKGEYPETDLSYIFVYIYEILHGVGVKDVEDGFLKLAYLWTSYRKIHPHLDRYLSAWIPDYLIIHLGEQDPTALLMKMPERDLLYLFPEYILVWYMRDPYVEFPIEFITRFTDYKFYTSKFLEADTDNLLFQYIPKVFQLIHQKKIQLARNGIFDGFIPEEISVKRRLPYQGAVYQGGAGRIDVPQLSLSEDAPFKAFCTSIIKYLENKLREKTGFRGRLKGIALPDDIKQLIDKFIDKEIQRRKEEQNRVKVEIDRDKILQLIHDSDVVRQKLLEDAAERGGEGSEAYQEDSSKNTGLDKITGNTGAEPMVKGLSVDEELKSKIVTEEPVEESEETTKKAVHKKRETDQEIEETIGETAGESREAAGKAANIFKGAGEERIGMGETSLRGSETNVKAQEAPFAQLISQLSVVEAKLLGILVENDYEMEEAELASRFPGTFIQMEIDHINELSLEYIGDILLMDKSGAWSILEEYREELKIIK